eukprot:1165921-Rhodomonas_salina.1
MDANTPPPCPMPPLPHCTDAFLRLSGVGGPTIWDIDSIIAAAAVSIFVGGAVHSSLTDSTEVGDPASEALGWDGFGLVLTISSPSSMFGSPILQGQLPRGIEAGISNKNNRGE